MFYTSEEEKSLAWAGIEMNRYFPYDRSSQFHPEPELFDRIFCVYFVSTISKKGGKRSQMTIIEILWNI